MDIVISDSEVGVAMATTCIVWISLQLLYIY